MISWAALFTSMSSVTLLFEQTFKQPTDGVNFCAAFLVNLLQMGNKATATFTSHRHLLVCKQINATVSIKDTGISHTTQMISKPDSIAFHCVVGIRALPDLRGVN